ncbi:hypothetical protein [Streptomyces sp. NBC_01198]|uniref:hypothetical protein n=1 Tax=Streptomyces sp. NBC_01198 TaxID=2903769 RepID=UPI002E0F7D5C|nr:hypothetical protein OG702_21625 [Streptomyces sp. NBC_01198]
MEFEDDLGDAMRRTADTFQPDHPAELVGAGHLRGRRLRRRRTATVVAGAAALAVVAVGGVLGSGIARSGDHGSGVAAAPEQPQLVGSASAVRPVSGQKVAQIFGRLLPAGSVKDLEGVGTEYRPYASATALFDDGAGPGEVTINLERGAGPVGDCPPAAQNPGTWCSITHVRGGILKVFKGWEYPDHRGGEKDWTATFVTSDDTGIQLSQWNSTREKGASATRTDPPLNVTEMTTMVTSDLWKPVLDALPDPAKCLKCGPVPGK